jgi:hypothetical protein
MTEYVERRNGFGCNRRHLSFCSDSECESRRQRTVVLQHEGGHVIYKMDGMNAFDAGTYRVSNPIKFVVLGDYVP